LSFSRQPTLLPLTDLESEADRLCQLVEQNAGPLRTAALGRAFRLDTAEFRLHATARNTIYRVQAGEAWFLKLTRDGSAGAMTHERQGALAIENTVENHPSYQGARVTRVSLDPAYVLAAAIPGRPLNKDFMLLAWGIFPGASNTLTRAFATMGTLLATLHGKAPIGPDVVAATTRPFQQLDQLLDRAKQPDETMQAIRAWRISHSHSDEGHAFQHGNFRLDNILRVGDRLGFIDFENSGSGTIYQDLSRPVAELLLTRSLLVSPRGRVTRSIVNFLRAYAAQQPFDAATLSDHVAARVARYYVESHARRFRASIGGIPVSRRKLTAMTVTLLERGLGDVVPETVY
jgi:Ser/Thr protein kinase RdoA (MazF antagonist)